jgi:hypothetical protein
VDEGTVANGATGVRCVALAGSAKNLDVGKGLKPVARSKSGGCNEAADGMWGFRVWLVNVLIL